MIEDLQRFLFRNFIFLALVLPGSMKRGIWQARWLDRVGITLYVKTCVIRCSVLLRSLIYVLCLEYYFYE